MLAFHHLMTCSGFSPNPPSSKVTRTATMKPGPCWPLCSFTTLCLLPHGAPCIYSQWALGEWALRGCYTLAVTGRNFCQQNKGLSMSSSITSLPTLSYTSSFSTFLQIPPLSLCFRDSSWAVSVVTALALWTLRCLFCILAWVLHTADPPFILFIHFFVFGLLRHVLQCSAGCPGTMKIKLAFNSQRSASRCLPSAGIRGVCYDHWFCKWFFNQIKPV